MENPGFRKDVLSMEGGGDFEESLIVPVCMQDVEALRSGNYGTFFQLADGNGYEASNSKLK